MNTNLFSLLRILLFSIYDALNTKHRNDKPHHHNYIEELDI